MNEATIIDGKAFAASLRERVGRAVAGVKAGHGITPGLAVVLVGEDPASTVYVGSKARQTGEVGMTSIEHRLAEDTSEAALLALIERMNNDPAINGILVQLPLPKHIDDQKVLTGINPDKDVDGFHTTNVGRLWTGGDSLVPCTPFGCLLLLRDHLGDLSGRSAVVIGRSNIVGKPMAALLIGENCTVTVAHSRTQDLPGRCREADILIAAVGRPEMVRGDWIKPGATVIDVGINRIRVSENDGSEDSTRKTRLVGDVDYDEACRVAGAITPVPGGVGPMTIACLLRNAVVACCRQNSIAAPDL